MTIGRNRRKLIERIFENGTDFRSYSLENSFTGKPVSSEWVQKEFQNFSFAKLQTSQPGKYMLYLHGRQWYKFDSLSMEE